MVSNMKCRILASRGNAFIGIWWYTDNKEIWAVECPVDNGQLDGVYLQLDGNRNHMNLWSSVVKSHIDDISKQEELLRLGYRCFERGRVIYNTATQCYEVTCSKDIYSDSEFQNAILKYFQLNGTRVDFVPLQHYHKLKLTGNPAVDSQLENIGW